MKTCSVCGSQVRKTTLANIVTKGKLHRRRVCAKCVQDKGFTVVAMDSLSICKCGKPATKCHACAHPVDEAVPKFAKVLRGRVEAYKRAPIPSMLEGAKHHAEGKIEGLEQAIELLESGRW